MNSEIEFPSVDKTPDRRDGLLRVNEIVRPDGLLPMSRSTWWAGVKDGRYPKPVKLGPRITAWRTSDIYALIDDGAI